MHRHGRDRGRAWRTSRPSRPRRASTRSSSGLRTSRSASASATTTGPSRIGSPSSGSSTPAWPMGSRPGSCWAMAHQHAPTSTWVPVPEHRHGPRADDRRGRPGARRRPTADSRHPRLRHTMQVLDFARSMILWRIDLDVLPPGTLSHRPPYPMNNSRIQIEIALPRGRQGDRPDPDVRPRALRARPSAWAPSATCSSSPTPTSCRSSATTRFMHLKTFARRGTARARFPPGSGDQPDRLRADQGQLRRRWSWSSSSGRASRCRCAGDLRGHPRQRDAGRQHDASATVATRPRSSTR